MVIKTLERVSKNYYYIIRGETLDFVIKREDVGEGISMKVFSENQSIDLL